jgi:putative selenium metabolism hydrolase
MEVAAKILELAWKYGEMTAGNLSELIKIKSLSRQEGEAAQALKKQMEAAGFDEVTIDPLGNVIGRIGWGRRILAVDAHLDTVGADSARDWEFDPFSGLIKDGCVCGRGSVEQKGGAAAAVTAGRILKEMGFPRDLTVYVTGTVMKEECEGLAWKYIVEEDKIRPEVVILTAPTNLDIYRGHIGRIELEVIFQGVSAPGVTPERGKNAIYAGSRGCLEIEKLNQRVMADDFLGKGSASVSEFISLSPALQAVPDYARIHVDRRLTWGETRESTIAELETIIHDRQARVEMVYYRNRSYTGLRYGMGKYFPTWKIPEDHPLMIIAGNAYEALFDEPPQLGRWDLSTSGVTIDGFFGIPCLGFGPGSDVLAHGANEWVPVDHLVKASAFYALFANMI